MKTIYIEDKETLMNKFEKILGHIPPKMKEIYELYDIDCLRADIDDYIRYKIIQNEKKKSRLSEIYKILINEKKINSDMTELDLKVAIGKWLEIRKWQVKDYMSINAD